jgi:hypothetical protein
MLTGTVDHTATERLKDDIAGAYFPFEFRR